ncbi:hypothetical protein [Peribacillus sp. V2I11]|uniref:hypothetical protein n=1 Tax=Peribacillus sp. V2I11 TaxID=3042277 RepID=UPI00277D9015|nr:hypothetical protein [Peribacillus sp. V2I11]MDQ0883038.1 hypothetical protein [Peribacillus sp. V2I11]
MEVADFLYVYMGNHEFTASIAAGLDVMVREWIVRSLPSYINFELQMVIMATYEIEMKSC